MPTYSYRCHDCGVEFDIQQAFSDPALTACEACGGTLRKLFSAVGVTFNGSGFYRTDSRASGSDKKSSAPSTPSESTSSATKTPSSTPSTTPSSS